MNFLKHIGPIFQLLALLTALTSLWTLEAERAEMPRTMIETPAGPVTLFGSETGPLVIVAHGFAGSSQMMQVISYDLAKAGFRVAAFDFVGHGRSTDLMSRDVSRIEGTTQQLVAQTVAVTTSIQEKHGSGQPIGFLGHSMATDVIIRAADKIQDVSAIVAISMYSDVVDERHPEKLLILSGEWENRLRDVALGAVQQIDGSADENETVIAGGVARRAAVVPQVGHVGVLYSPTTLQEVRNWLADAFELDTVTPGARRAWAIPGFLISLIVLSGLVARTLPMRALSVDPLPRNRFLTALFTPIVPAIGAAFLFGGAVLGIAAFGYLLIFFVIWGAVALSILLYSGPRLQGFSPRGFFTLLSICLIFAIALDRYGAAFLPTGPRLGLMAVLLVGTVPFMLADALMVANAALWRRVMVRIVPLASLFGLLMLAPQDFGLLFTVLPVMVLFYLVFCTMGRMMICRIGAPTTGLALGVMLAWSIAASQPLFEAVI